MLLILPLAPSPSLSVALFLFLRAYTPCRWWESSARAEIAEEEGNRLCESRARRGENSKSAKGSGSLGWPLVLRWKRVWERAAGKLVLRATKTGPYSRVRRCGIELDGRRCGCDLTGLSNYKGGAGLDSDVIEVTPFSGAIVFVKFIYEPA